MMTLRNDMELLNNLLDVIGFTTFIAALGMRITEYFSIVNWNDLITFFMSLAGLTYIIFKCINEFWKIKETRKKLK